ncbi:glutathione peroxidase [Paenibacillus hamazuiensis]|uniref:glutathione peroxidase n=1 Tax=Paenibacillus hamazuiensis TaxID=2936508 RepID=UPI00200D5CA8|nr:glutathione peroxidase [Paenibacillus hamazuiensis]
MSIYDIEVKTAEGQPKSLWDFEGQVLLIVNVASKCGFTNQYEGLEQLYRTYKDRGFRILAFPCNDFGGQEPGTLEEIKEFCSLNYGVTFELFDKVRILGEDKHPLYAYLTEHAEPAGDVQWNFEKFLIGKDGAIAGRYSSKVTPDDEQLVKDITSLL